MDGIGGTVKWSVWKYVKAGRDAPLNAESYANIAKELNPNISVIIQRYLDYNPWYYLHNVHSFHLTAYK